MTLERRTPLRAKAALRAGTGLARRTPLRGRGGLRASRAGDLAPVSEKRRAALVAYAQALRVVDARDLRRCAAAPYAVRVGYCEGRPDQPDIVHHHRAGRDNDRLVDVADIVSLCPGHHDWVHAHPVEARGLGLMA